MGYVYALVNDSSPIGPIDTSDQIKDRRLSCSIGPHHPQDLSFFNMEGEVVNRGQVPKSLCQILNG